MNVLILYGSKSGATRLIAEQLKGAFAESDASVTMQNIKDGKPDLNKYDTVIIGGCVYMNKLHKKISSYVKANEKALMTKKLGLFIGCYTPSGTEGYLEQFFTPALLAHAAAKDMLGGLMQYDKMNIIYRKIFTSLKKIDDFNKNFVEPKIETERIASFAERMKSIS